MEMVTDLVTALENATLMAKQLPATVPGSGTGQIFASLHAAHRHLSLFLAHTASQPSADVINGDDTQMQLSDEEQQMVTIDTVEDRMKDCCIQKNKRRKRSSSPPSFAPGERRRWLECEIESARAQVDYDPHVTKLRALDLIYQFHC